MSGLESPVTSTGLHPTPDDGTVPSSPVHTVDSGSTPTISPSRPRLPSLSIPKRTSSKRALSAASWDHKFAGKSISDLHQVLKETKEKLSQARKRLKRPGFMDHEYWDQYSDILQLLQDEFSARSQLEFAEFKASKPNTDWYQQDRAKDLKAQYDGLKQLESIARKQRQKLFDRAKATREYFARLFATSRLGLDLPAGVDRRNPSPSERTNMVNSMLEAYCPNHSEVWRWDPVLHKYQYSQLVHAAHLFPWRQSQSMDLIFGDGASKELFTPANGLFLHFMVERALDKGLIAIVPDVDLEPADTLRPLDAQQAGASRLQEWEQQTIKNYKLAVIKKGTPEVREKVFDLDSIETLEDLHGRKLVFQTDARPRARYVWWTFMNSILRTAWNESSRDSNTQHQVRKAMRYWRTRRAYLKRRFLLGFVEMLGADVEAIMDVDVGENEPDTESDYTAISAMANDAVAKASCRDQQQEDDDDDYDVAQDLKMEGV